MIFPETFLLNKSGLFDFDLTFFAESTEFIFLSLIVTFWFIAPISKQLTERADFINQNLRRSLATLTFGYNKINSCLTVLILEITEMTRQVKMVKAYCSEQFEAEVSFVQKENGRLLSKLKGILAIQSAYIFSNTITDITSLTNTFFSKKFKV